jgi:hypothetical protein
MDLTFGSVRNELFEQMSGPKPHQNLCFLVFLYFDATGMMWLSSKRVQM